jgi:spermidine synthase
VVMGLGTMALEILVLVLYQIRLGSLYRELGLLIAAFMAGMAAGSAAGSRRTGRWRGPPLLAGLQGGLAVLAVSLALWLQGGGAVSAAWSESWTRAGYILVLLAAGFGGGGIFAASAALWQELRPQGRGQGGMLYAADLLGATLVLARRRPPAGAAPGPQTLTPKPIGTGVSKHGRTIYYFNNLIILIYDYFIN